jgi:multicomponent Na+:H+ antiporter subunit C
MILYLMCYALFLIGIYGLLTKRDLIKLILAGGVMGYAGNLFLILIAYKTGAGVPIYIKGMEPGSMVNPLPQALVLTSIVIELGTTAMLVALALRLLQKYKTFDINKIRRLRG